MKFSATVCLCWGALAANGPAMSLWEEQVSPIAGAASAPVFAASATSNAASMLDPTAGHQSQGSRDTARIEDIEIVRRVNVTAPDLQKTAEELFEEAKAWEGRDPLRSRSLYERACDLDHGESCSRGAALYEKKSLNRSGAANTIASYRLYIFGCANSHWNACFMLGHILTQRHSTPYPNVPLDKASGLRYYELACVNGVKQACENIEHIAS